MTTTEAPFATTLSVTVDDDDDWPSKSNDDAIERSRPVRGFSNFATIVLMVSEQDREYMRRIGEAKAAAHAEATSEHLQLPPIERLRRSFAMSATMRHHANLEARIDDPSAFYEKARARGLCDP